MSQNFLDNKFLDRLEDVSIIQIILDPEDEEQCVLQKDFIFSAKIRISIFYLILKNGDKLGLTPTIDMFHHAIKS